MTTILSRNPTLTIKNNILTDVQVAVLDLIIWKWNW